MADTKHNDDQWQPCPTGELTGMVERLDRADRWNRRKQVASVVVVSSAVYACVVLAVGSWMSANNTHYGGISCSYCKNHFSEYASHLTGEAPHADQKFVASMKEHLEKCTFCRGKFEASYPIELTAGLGVARPLVASLWQPSFTLQQATWR